MALDIGMVCTVGTVLIITAVLFALILRHRIVFYMAWRNFLRHRTHTALVVAGLLIGTAIITASMALGDSLNHGSTERIYRELDQTDIVVSPIDMEIGGYMNYSVYEAISSDSYIHKHTDGISPMIVETPLAVINTNNSRMQMGFSFESFGGKIIRLMGIDYEKDRGFGPFYTKSGKIYGTDDPNGAIVNERLAEEMELEVGQKIMVLYYVYETQPNTNTTIPTGTNATNANMSMSNMTTASPSQSISTFGKARVSIAILNVTAIAEDRGKSAFLGGLNIYLSLNRMQEMFKKEGEINYIRISNKGDIYQGLGYSDDVKARIEDVLREKFPEDEGRMKVDAIKQRRIDAVQNSSTNFSGFLIMLSGFTIAAGALLIINIFVMLAEERKVELGISRAVGMKRRHLLYLFTFEGMFYNVLATLAGVFIGLLVALGVITSFNTIFPTATTMNLTLYVLPSTPFVAFVLGFIMTFVVIILASWKASHLNIISAIRNLEDYNMGEGGVGHRRLYLGLAVLSGIGLLSYLPAQSIDAAIMFVQFISPVVLTSAVFMYLRPRFGPRLSMSIMSAIIIVFVAAYLLYGPESDDSMSFVVFVAEGITLVLSSVVLFVYNAETIFAPLKKLGTRNGRTKALILPAIAYPMHKRFRSGMTAAMFSLVIFILVLFTVFFNLFTPDPDKESGGYEIWGGMDGQITSLDDLDRATAFLEMAAGNGSSVGSMGGGMAERNTTNATERYNASNPYSAIDFRAILKNNTIDYDPKGDIEYFDVMWQCVVFSEDKLIGHYSYKEHAGGAGGGGGMGGGMRQERPRYFTTTVFSPDRNFTRHNNLKFLERDKGMDREEVWDGLMASDDGVILTRYTAMDPDGGEHHPGEYFALVVNNVTYRYRIIGVLDSQVITGVFMSPSAFLNITNGSRISSSIYIKVKEGVDPHAVVDKLEDKYGIFGFNAVVFEDVYYEVFNAIASVFNVFKAFLGLGLIVGYASLGVIGIRNSIERRREIGMMRAVGFKRRDITTTFIIEGLFVTTVGVVIGLITALLATYGIYLATIKDLDIPYTVPIYDIGMILIVVYVASLLSIIVPAIKASKIPVAEAVRYYE